MASGRFSILALAGLLLAVAFPTPAGAQAENRLAVSAAWNPKFLNPDVLLGGRLPVDGTELHIEFAFEVTAPALTVCPLQPITITFLVDKDAGWAQQATAVLSVVQTSFFIDQAQNPLVPNRYGPFLTTASLSFTRLAPAFQSLDLGVTAQALPGGGTTGGCNLAISQPLRVGTLVRADYLPELSISAPGWSGTTPEPVTVSNLGNGLSRVVLLAHTTDGSTGRLGPSVLLESFAESGKNAQTTAVILLDRAQLPQNWDRTFTVEARSVFDAPDLRIFQETFAV